MPRYMLYHHMESKVWMSPPLYLSYPMYYHMPYQLQFPLHHLSDHPHPKLLRMLPPLLQIPIVQHDSPNFRKCGMSTIGKIVDV